MMLLWNCMHLHAENFFQAEATALQLNMPSLAEKTLQSHIFDAFPQGSECRLLLAKANFLKREFDQMQNHLSLMEKNHSYDYLHLLWNHYVNNYTPLASLWFYPQVDVLGNFLSNYNRVVHEPLKSIRWANFWGKVATDYSLKNYAKLYQWALEVKFSMEQSFFFEEADVTIWPSVVHFLFTQQRYESLDVFLKRILKEIRNRHERLYCLLWILKTKHALKESPDESILSYLINEEDDIEALDAIFSEWLLLVPEVKQQLNGLKRFCKIYKRKNLHLHYQYLQLLQARCYIDLNEFEKAKKILDKHIYKLDKSLKVFGYELLGKYALSKQPVNYRLAADYFDEAKQRAQSVEKNIFYGQLQAECYCLNAEYERAFCIYEELVGKAINLSVGSKLAYEWVLCGILCLESADELQHQIVFCRSLNLLNVKQEQHLHWLFAKNLLERKQYVSAMRYLQNTKWDIDFYQASAKFLYGKVNYLLGNYKEAKEIFKGIDVSLFTSETLADYYLWQGYVSYELEDDDSVASWLDVFEGVTGVVPMDMRVQAKLLRAKLLARQHFWGKAKKLLLSFCPQVDFEWRLFLMFQAGCYAEKDGNEGRQEAIQIFQKLYEMSPHHPLALDARLKQGVRLLNLNQIDLAQAVFSSVLPELKQKEQIIWCRYLLQKCLLNSHKQALAVSSAQLEMLLKEVMPLSLRLEIVLQLAFIYKDEGNLNALQKLLWDESYPLLTRENPLFTVNEVYWLSRCLFVLVQNTNDKNVVHQIYTLMVEADLPNASLIQQYLEGM